GCCAGRPDRKDHTMKYTDEDVERAARAIRSYMDDWCVDFESVLPGAGVSVDRLQEHVSEMARAALDSLPDPQPQVSADVLANVVENYTPDGVVTWLNAWLNGDAKARQRMALLMVTQSEAHVPVTAPVPQPHQVTTVEELEALPVGVIVHSKAGTIAC